MAIRKRLTKTNAWKQKIEFRQKENENEEDDDEKENHFWKKTDEKNR